MTPRASRPPALRRRTAPARTDFDLDAATQADRDLVRRSHPASADAASRGRRPYSRAESVAVTQGAFYTATGVWPIAHLGSFEAVTGPKPEGWLVKTVGGLIGVAGAALASAGLRRRVTPEIALLGAGCAAVLAAIDVVYVARRRISPVYLLDAVAEGVLIAGWVSAARELREGAESEDDEWWIDFGPDAELDADLDAELGLDAEDDGGDDDTYFGSDDDGSDDDLDDADLDDADLDDADLDDDDLDDEDDDFAAAEASGDADRARPDDDR